MSKSCRNYLRRLFGEEPKIRFQMSIGKQPTRNESSALIAARSPISRCYEERIRSALSVSRTINVSAPLSQAFRLGPILQKPSFETKGGFRCS